MKEFTNINKQMLEAGLRIIASHRDEPASAEYAQDVLDGKINPIDDLPHESPEAEKASATNIASRCSNQMLINRLQALRLVDVNSNNIFANAIFHQVFVGETPQEHSDWARYEKDSPLGQEAANEIMRLQNALLNAAILYSTLHKKLKGMQ